MSAGLQKHTYAASRSKCRRAVHARSQEHFRNSYCFLSFPLELELAVGVRRALEFPMTLFMLGGEMFVALTGIAGLAFVSELVR